MVFTAVNTESSTTTKQNGNHAMDTTTSQNGNQKKPTSTDLIALEHEYAAHNYHPLPVVLERGEGALVWDVEEKVYIDMLSAYSAVNQGHCHPKIVQSLIEQARILTLSSRAFHNSTFGPFSQLITKMFGYEMVLPMNTGAEAVETALKLARKWAYTKKKGIKDGEAIILSAQGNFHGRTMGIISMSTDPESRGGYAPYLPGLGPEYDLGKGVKKGIRFNNVDDLREVLEAIGDKVAAFLVEPIQGEAGIIVPADNYLTECQALCKKHNVLLVCDEIQTGLCRTGKMMCYEHDLQAPNKPDIVLLGKALSGGVYPVSAVLADKEIMLCIQPGQHGSTYGGNPLACAVATTALQVLVSEQLSERAERLGKVFRDSIKALNSPLVKEVRGRGLLNAVEIDESKSVKQRTAWQLCLLLKERGVLAKPTHQNIIRFAPPLVIKETDLMHAIEVIGNSIADLDTLDTIPGDAEEQSYHPTLEL